ncbi:MULTISPECIES: response regulator [Desulfococcus]|jgi:DNA-binding NarL/FixJ family response regulator|uniref:Two component transcriptional regulator, LuxR family n=1 Tax=Desulfococcus multivorans DSM 2059 TaxID=1121405 RepID=S7U067_DESML|nr:response regulator transcription factor [Desulfococcus multivorans]AOY59315.1 two component system response regulator, LuxR-type [Desulfococcus multivorans]AQV01534.1 DNA-binding response regulator [Desulfococcus multivorans]EPR42380.1 two component transcriptional regulator, LuxR family [Desulfococcus multivorans DSM 2059]MDX9819430.1 response regulator transcription factor [Desulfococcus multivorans]SKA14547.1 two component transcriptional regulator, LuxR family [Desulfococcus multivorans
MNIYTIILADDHVILRQGIRKIIEDENGLKVIDEVGDGLALLKTLKINTPDMVIVDISMPRIRGIEAVSEIKANYPNIKVLILSMHKSRQYLLQAVSVGADGYLLKEDTDDELFTAIKTIRKGKVYLSPSMTRGLTQTFIDACINGPDVNTEPLSVREKEVLKMVVEGYTCKDISELLHISLRTVQHHRANIHKKLRIKKMPDLVKYAMDNGYISMTD